MNGGEGHNVVDEKMEEISGRPKRTLRCGDAEQSERKRERERAEPACYSTA